MPQELRYVSRSDRIFNRIIYGTLICGGLAGVGCALAHVITGTDDYHSNIWTKSGAGLGVLLGFWCLYLRVKSGDEVVFSTSPCPTPPESCDKPAASLGGDGVGEAD